MPSFNDIGLAEPSTITKRVATVTVTRNSSVMHQEILCLGDPDSTNGIASVLNATPASTAWALSVREVGTPGASSVSSVAGRVAFAGYHQSGSIVNVTDSTNNAINVNVVAGAAAGSTIVTVSTVTGRVAFAGYHQSGSIINVTDSTNNAINVNVVAGAAAGSTQVTVGAVGVSTFAQNSSAYLPVRFTDGTAFITPGAEFTDASTASTLTGPALLYNNSSANTMRMVGVTQPLPVQLRTSAGVSADFSTIVTVAAWGANVQSSAAAAAGSSALLVREVYPLLASTRFVITSSNSTALYTLVSSAASVGHKVFAYSLTSTETSPSTLVFYSSNAGDKWAVAFGSGSSGVAGANLAIGPPAFLFRSAANEALRCLVEKGASTQSILTLSIGYFSEP